MRKAEIPRTQKALSEKETKRTDLLEFPRAVLAKCEKLHDLNGNVFLHAVRDGVSKVKVWPD